MKIYLILFATIFLSCSKEKIKNSSPIDAYFDIFVSGADGTNDWLNPESQNSFDINKIKVFYKSYSKTGIEYRTTGLVTSLIHGEDGVFLLRLSPQCCDLPIIAKSIIEINWPDNSMDTFTINNLEFGNGGWTTVEIIVNGISIWDKTSPDSVRFRSVYLQK